VFSINDNTKLTVSRKVSPLWRNRDYMFLWSGQLVSSIGSGVSGVAFPLLILAVTGSPAQAGVAAALSELPYLINHQDSIWRGERFPDICEQRIPYSLAIPFGPTQ
jgi:hypothetical protein